MLVNYPKTCLYCPWTWAYLKEIKTIYKDRIYQYIRLRRGEPFKIRLVEVLEDDLKVQSVGMVRYTTSYYIELRDIKTGKIFKVPERTLGKHHIIRHIS